MARVSVDCAGRGSGQKRKLPGDAENDKNHEGMTKSKGQAGGDFDSSNGGEILVRIESDVFDCPICCCALRPPIHQCPNGHLLCSSCFFSLPEKCPSCFEFMGLIRCLALESVIESMKISCSNARYGCDAILSYLDRADHQRSCMYSACSCPKSACSYRASITRLSQHFTEKHENSAVKFSYGRRFRVVVHDEQCFILQSSDNRLFLLLQNSDVTGGNTLSVICICPATKDHMFKYELSVAVSPTHLKLESSAEMMCEWNGDHPEVSLFVPHGLCPGNIIVNVSIRKVNVGQSSVGRNHA